MKKIFHSKKSIVWITVVGIILCIGIVVFVVRFIPGPKVEITEEMDRAVSKAILEYNGERYRRGECAGEGHKIFQARESKYRLKVYTLCSYNEYIFENGKIAKEISSSNNCPTVITFTRKADGSYKLKDYEEPMDGEMNYSSTERMFPKEIFESVWRPSDEIEKSLEEQCLRYATAYLKEKSR